MEEEAWRRCSTCKEPIGFAAPYWACSVSTCNRAAASLVFCSVECWDAHVPVVRHRDAWANEERSPSRAEREAALRAERESQEAREARRVPGAAPGGRDPREANNRAADPPRPTLASERGGNDPMSDDAKEVLVVVSKLKSYIRSTAGMNTSDAVAGVLSDRIREICDQAVAKAKGEGRKTVLDRDF